MNILALVFVVFLIIAIIVLCSDDYNSPNTT